MSAYKNMTTIAYHQGFLYADTRRVLFKKPPATSIVEDHAEPKVKILSLEGKPIAFTAGSPQTVSNTGAFTSVLFSQNYLEMLKALAGALNDDLRTFEEKDEHHIIVTRTEVIYVTSSGHVGLADDSDQPLCIGSGRWIAHGYLRGGGDPRRMMQAVSRKDFMTSPVTHVFDRSQLFEIPRNHANGDLNIEEFCK